MPVQLSFFVSSPFAVEAAEIYCRPGKNWHNTTRLRIELNPVYCQITSFFLWYGVFVENLDAQGNLGSTEAGNIHFICAYPLLFTG